MHILNNLYESFCFNKQRLGVLGILVLLRSSFYFKFCMLLIRVSQSRATCCGDSNWRFIIRQSIHELCRASQNNLMMIRFFGNEMTLKTTLIVWQLMVTFNALVSYVTSPNERFQALMTSIEICVLFSTRANSYCCTYFLLMKHVDVPKSRSVWASIVINLLHLTLISTKKHGARSKDSWNHFHYMMY
jgi:hypothetical protein